MSFLSENNNNWVKKTKKKIAVSGARTRVTPVENRRLSPLEYFNPRFEISIFNNSGIYWSISKPNTSFFSEKWSLSASINKNKKLKSRKSRFLCFASGNDRKCRTKYLFPYCTFQSIYLADHKVSKWNL